MDGDTGRQADDGGRSIEALEAKLNVYALANGMDLVRGPSIRRLEWHRDGLERGILLEIAEDGGLGLVALAWSFGDPASVKTAKIADALEAGAVLGDLSALLQRTLDAANAL